MRLLLRFVIVGMLAFGGMAQAVENQTYDLIFKTGTLSDIDEAAGLTYQRSTAAAWRNPPEKLVDGDLALSLEADDSTMLSFAATGGPKRNIGSFPTSVGNPTIMYFMESAIKDISEATGGSPFYIRNRFKDSLLQFAEIEQVSVPYQGQDVSAQQITLRPFLKDKNRHKMGQYADLEMRVTVSSDIPGWYYSLIADVAGPELDTLLYENKIVIRSASQ